MSYVMAVEDRIQLASMQQLAEAVEMDDVWTGRTDPAVRRKRQNRLNQRAYRKRKALEYQSNGSPSNIQEQTQNCYLVRSEDKGFPPAVRPSSALPKTPPLIPYVTPTQPAIIFPLPLDHLLTLVQYNVLRAVITNMTIMSVLDSMPAECGAAWGVRPMDTPNLSSIPPYLSPTPLQRSTPHEPWIDILPCGAFRDNLIIATKDPSFDEDSFCVDIVGGLFEGYNEVEMRGIVVWSDPWHPTGWEVTEGFLKKWGFLLRGCKEVMESTNRWRALRNEDSLVWEL